MLYQVQFFTLIIGLLLSPVPASGQNTPVGHAVFFYDPDCENRLLGMTKVFMPLKFRYGNQRNMFYVNTTQTEGWDLYQAMNHCLKLTDDRLGIPTMVIGNAVLVVAGEIPTMLPGLIEIGFAHGSVSWPDIHGPVEYNTNPTPTDEVPSPHVSNQSGWENTETISTENLSVWKRFTLNIENDLIANSLAIITLGGMILSIILILAVLTRTILNKNLVQISSHYPGWLIPLLVVIGLGVAGYLSFVEVSEKQAICGPVGLCNEVQNSPDAKIFGVLPVGILGLVGYFSILVSWVIQKIGPKKYRTTSSLLLWVMALFGVVFSIYLTYLEPFIIGATCLWCLSSAIIMTVIFWVTTPEVQELLLIEDITEEQLLE